MINIPKGTKDVLPNESYKWQYIESKAREVAELFCAREIRTPVFEHTELFCRTIGDATDVVSKEMYTFTDKGENSLTLKPEGTAAVIRSYVENSLSSLSLPLKMYYIIPAFRRERPQKGRFREFHQFGVEYVGGSTPALDYEVIALADTLIKKLGIKAVDLQINSMGCPKCRPNYTRALKSYFADYKSRLCGTCNDRFDKNPLRLLDCKSEECKNIAKTAPKITSYLCEECSGHMSEVKRLLQGGGIEFTENPDIVRGLDYYTKTVFEFSTNLLGSQGQVFGGGRYDGLVEEIGGVSTGCVGFAAGMERLLMLMEESGAKIPEKQLCNVFVMSQSQICRDECNRIVRELRQSGISADTDLTGKSLKAQFKFADKINAEYAIVVGESEMQSGTVSIKRLSDGKVNQSKISEIIQSITNFN